MRKRTAGLFCLLAACAGGSPTRSALDAVAERADVGYAETGRACLIAEQTALAVSPTREVWNAARDRIRSVCNPAIAAWETVRTAHQKASAAAESCEQRPDAACIDSARAAIDEARDAVQHAEDTWSAARGVIANPVPVPGPTEPDGGEVAAPDASEAP
jgi:hypothetical protein